MAGKPYLPFFPGDWLRDDVSACSLAAQGLWLRMMITAHDSANYGFLEVNGAPMPNAMIARKCGCSLQEFEELLAELESAGVPSRSGHGSIYSRRMVRDGAQRKQTSKKRSEAGKAGAEARWQKDDKPMANAMANAMAKNGLSSSSSISSSSEDLYLQGENQELDQLTQLERDILTGMNQSPKFKQIWAELPKSLQGGDDGVWRTWHETIRKVMRKHGVDFDAAHDHILHRVKMFSRSDKGKRTECQWSAKTFFSEGHYDSNPASWEIKRRPTPQKTQSGPPVPEKCPAPPAVTERNLR